MINHPPYLQPGACIGITCPSAYVSVERVAPAVAILESWGYRAKLGKTVGSEHNYFSGTDAQRLADLQEMLDDREVDAILMGRGGYGMSRIIDDLNFSAFIQRPKWICGFSDITVLHNHLQNNFGMASLHSPMCGALKPQTMQAAHILNFKDALAGKELEYHVPPSSFNRLGNTTGVLTGGNLAILAHLTGSVSEVDTTNKILFIEDIGEYLYNADRLLLNLKRAGKLKNLKALIVGDFTDMQDTDRPFGQGIEEIIYNIVKEYHYPLCFNFPVGHADINYTLTLGAEHRLQVNAQGAILKLVR
jgi:muramoyltetrapeptide carboxypeptidase